MQYISAFLRIFIKAYIQQVIIIAEGGVMKLAPTQGNNLIPPSLFLKREEALMKKLRILSLLAAATLLITSCADDNYSELDPWNGGGTTPGGQGGVGNATGDDLETFDIAFDTSALTESETVPSDASDEAYDDYIEHSSFTRQVTINYNGSSATVEGDTDGVDISIDGGHVTVVNGNKEMEFILTGSTSDGSFKSYSDYKFKLTLNNVTITNPSGPAINNQSHKRTFVELSSGSTNTLTDGSSYTNIPDDEDCKGCFFSEGQLILSGGGTLNLSANSKNGLCSDDYVRLRSGNVVNITSSKSNGIKSNDGVHVSGGVLNINVTAAAAKGISSDGHVTIDGGRTTIITSGDGEWDSDARDTNACAGIKSDSTFTINGGQLYIKSTGAGGKGINGDQTLTFNGGTVKILTTGARYTYGNYHSSAKGIKGDGNVVINDGSIIVRASGGEGSEGIESKQNININGGTVEVSSYDDAINVSNKYSLTINGGSIYAYATSNDAIDSNGSISINGGTVIAAGATQPEGGIDVDNSAIAINGGTVIALGGENSSVSTSSKQLSLVTGNQVSAGTIMAVTCGSSNVLSYKVPRTFSQMIISSPKLSSGSSWSIISGASTSGGTTFHGLTSGGTSSGGTSIASGTLSSTVTYSNTSSSGMQGGGMPGGWH